MAEDAGQSSPADALQGPASYGLDELAWPQVEAALRRDSRLLFPVGALEQHGPHLPLGTNSLIVDRLARDLSRALGILRAPTFQYGVTVPSKRGFPGRASLRRKTFHRTVNELLANWEDHGVTEFILLTAQRYEPHLDALLMALTQRAETTVIDVRSVDVGDLLEQPTEWEHGGEMETSLMLHLAPELVRVDRIADTPLPPGRRRRRYLRGQMPTPPPDSMGAVGFPSLASAEKGRLIYERLLAAIRDGWLVRSIPTSHST